MLLQKLSSSDSLNAGETKNLLLVEDDKTVSYAFCYSLRKHNYNVVIADSGESAYKSFMQTRFDVCIIDVKLTGSLNGINLTKKIRSKNNYLPIILISSDDCVSTKLTAFDAGADDYVTKPVHPLELIGRINVLTKRLDKSPKNSPTSFYIGDMIFDYSNLLLKCDWMEFRLTELEGALLRYFCLHPNKLIRKDDLALKLWGKNDKFINRSIDVYLSKIRRYLKPQKYAILETIRGAGIQFNVDSNFFGAINDQPRDEYLEAASA